MEAYSDPDYHEIAFGVADPAREVDFFAAAIRACAGPGRIWRLVQRF